MAHDLIILGGGPGGYNAAERAAEAGMDVVLFEKRALGGVCLNEGCIPTKTFLYSAKLADGAVHGAPYGVRVDGTVSIDHPAVVQRKNAVVKKLTGGVAASMKTNGVRVVDSEARIAGRTPEGLLRVEADGEPYEAKYLLIATGSEAAFPPIDGLRDQYDLGFAVTSREMLDLEEVPEKLVVIGGGVIGMEMASYFNSAGSDVVVVEMLDHKIYIYNTLPPYIFFPALHDLPLPPVCQSLLLFCILPPQKPGSLHGLQSNPLRPACIYSSFPEE